jgi:putative NADH-flavin reductase
LLGLAEPREQTNRRSEANVRLLVVGAGSRLGREIVSQALSHGHQVTALVHDQTAPAASDPDVRVVQGDVLDFQVASSAVLGQDAVISALSHGRENGGRLLAEGMGNIVHAMATYRVDKLVVISSSGAFARQDRGLPFGRRALIGTAGRGTYDDLEAMERRVMASDLDWTIIRPSGLTDGPLTGSYRVSLEGVVLKGAKKVSRADVAALALKAVGVTAYSRRAVSIAG